MLKSWIQRKLKYLWNLKVNHRRKLYINVNIMNDFKPIKKRLTGSAKFLQYE